MAVSANGTLDTNIKGSNGVGIALTDETMLTLYVSGRSGSHHKHIVCLEVSPDGTNYYDLPEVIVGEGIRTYNIVAAGVKVKVAKSEEAPSEIKVHLLAR